MDSKRDLGFGSYGSGICSSGHLYRSYSTTAAIRGPGTYANSRLCLDRGLLGLGRREVSMETRSVAEASL
jgi:hypothetical protein